MPLRFYVPDEDNPTREEKNNSQYIGQEVFIKGKIIEVADSFPGGVRVSFMANDEDDNGTEYEAEQSFSYNSASLVELDNVEVEIALENDDE